MTQLPYSTWTVKKSSRTQYDGGAEKLKRARAREVVDGNTQFGSFFLAYIQSMCLYIALDKANPNSNFFEGINFFKPQRLSKAMCTISQTRLQ
jgi:hypothetical protein